jgi:hypothetical protein
MSSLEERLGLEEGNKRDVGRGRGVWGVGRRRGRGVGEGEGFYVRGWIAVDESQGGRRRGTPQARARACVSVT